MPLVDLRLGEEQLSNGQRVTLDSCTAMVRISCGFGLHAQVPPCSSPPRWIGKLSTSVCCALQMQRADALDAQLQQEWGEILAAQGRSTEAATHLSAAAALFTQQMAEAPHVLVVRL